MLFRNTLTGKETNVKYIIMCGGFHVGDDPKHLWMIRKETTLIRAIRLLRDLNESNIIISCNNPIFNKYGTILLQPDEPKPTCWIDGAFPIIDEDPVTYIFGDVFFSPDAMKTIVETETSDVEFFASAPPFHPKYPKKYAEPFAFKVTNVQHFKESIDKTRELYKEGVLKRCIAWELWQVIKGTPLNRIDYRNYTVINDYTCDIDTKDQAQYLDTLVRMYGLTQEE